MKYVDESTGIDLFAEMERDEKTYLDGKHYHLKLMQLFIIIFNLLLYKNLPSLYSKCVKSLTIIAHSRFLEIYVFKNKLNTTRLYQVL